MLADKRIFTTFAAVKFNGYYHGKSYQKESA